MKRQVEMKDISDGKLYGINDMVKADCGDCQGCSSCCEGMGQSIILDPLDIFRLLQGLNITFEQLLSDSIELNVVDGVILPNMKMSVGKESCPYLNEKGRCSIHSFRPGMCRIFPLGRYYEEDGFKYFLQIHECKITNRSKVKVKKWIDTPDLKQNQQYIMDWHNFLIYAQNLMQGENGETLSKTLNMYVLKNFYMEPYDKSADFYEQFAQRLQEAKEYFHFQTV